MGKKRTIDRQHELDWFPPPNSPMAQQYYHVTQRPWPSLVFILPGLIFFELGTYFRHGAQGGASSELVAAYLIERLVKAFGAGGFYFPGLMLVAILLAWHIAGKHPWRFDIHVLAGMLGESLIWTIPLFVFDRVMCQAVLVGSSLGRSQWFDEIIRSFGAGIYEELVFRLICIAALDILLVNIIHLPRAPARVFIMLASAAIFAAQHHPPLGAEPFNMGKFLFRTAAGVYLAGLFVFRGFGIAAGCHAFYNVIVVTSGALEP